MSLFFLGIGLLLSEIHPVIVPQSSLIQTALPLSDEDEVLAVDRLIVLTKEQLAVQAHLKELMMSFKKHKEKSVIRSCEKSCRRIKGE